MEDRKWSSQLLGQKGWKPDTSTIKCCWRPVVNLVDDLCRLIFLRLLQDVGFCPQLGYNYHPFHFLLNL